MEGTPTLEDLFRKNKFAISFDLKEFYNHIPVHPTLQNTIYVNYLHISGDSLKPQQCPPSIYSNNEKMCDGNQKDMEDQMCSLLGRLATSSSQQKNILDVQFRKISPKAISTIPIPGIDLELQKYDGTTSTNTV
jgi:hypothetical protein